MRRHYLIDASALVPYFLSPSGPAQRPRLAIYRLLKLREEKKAVLHIPNFCMAECSKAFARLAFGSTKSYEKARDIYFKQVEALIDTVSRSRRGLIQSYGLRRKHLVDIEEVFTAQYRLSPRKGRKHLSGLDALIISIGRSLLKTYGRDNVFIVTGDEWMAQVCNQCQEFLPKAIYVMKDVVPDG